MGIIIKQIIEKICCKHDWEVYQPVTIDYIAWRPAAKVMYDILKCKRCGKFKKLIIMDTRK